MRTTAIRFLVGITAALMLSACGGDTATGPGTASSPSAPSGGSPSAAPSSISNDLATSAGNSIASDLESLSDNEVVAGVAPLTFSVQMRFTEGSTASSTPSLTTSCTYNETTKIYTCIKTAPDTGWDCKKMTDSSLYVCTKSATTTASTTPASTPTAAPVGTCTYDAAARVYTCIKSAPDSGWTCTKMVDGPLYVCTKPAPVATNDTTKTSAPPPATTPKPATPTEVCLLDPATLLYTCTQSVHDGLVSVRSYGFFDASGKAMSSFVKGTTASVRYLTKTDGALAHDSVNYGVTHQLRDLIVSGFLGATRIWNGAGTSTDTTIHTEGAAKRTYTGVSVDTMKAVTYAEERSTNPYPLSGTSIRVMNYTVVSIGKATETSTVSQRAVVTYNGTKDVPIVLGVYTCTLHLDTHKVDSCK